MLLGDDRARAQFSFGLTGRPPRPHQWSSAKIVTFIVTLAAGHSVTLAASCAGMSRKSAYALKRRDPAFAAAWKAALASGATLARRG